MILAKSQAEKIANRGFDAGSRFAIPIHPNYQRLEMIRIIAGNRHPYMRDQAGAGFVQQSQSLSRGKWTSIRICSAAVITGGAMLHVILGLGQIIKPGWAILCTQERNTYEVNSKKCLDHASDSSLKNGQIVLNEKGLFLPPRWGL